MAQDDYYYEIQLTNKQLVFYFMAGATGLILSFLAGIMVGRGVDAGAGDVQASRPAAEERIVEETPAPAPPASEDLTYAKRLEGEKADDGLERAKGAPAGATKGATSRAAEVATVVGRAEAPPSVPRTVSSPAGTAAPSGTAAPAAAGSVAGAASVGVPATRVPPAGKPAAVKPGVPGPGFPLQSAAGTKNAGPAPGSFAIQVGAFKDGASAESVVGQLKTKGFAAYVVPPAAPEGLFNVRVGSYKARADAEKVQARLRYQEKFKPFIVSP